MILTYFESIFRTEFSQGYQIFVFFNWISDYHEDQFQKSSAGSEILENILIKSESMNQYEICIQDYENL